MRMSRVLAVRNDILGVIRINSLCWHREANLRPATEVSLDHLARR